MQIRDSRSSPPTSRCQGAFGECSSFIDGTDATGMALVPTPGCLCQNLQIPLKGAQTGVPDRKLLQGKTCRIHLSLGAFSTDRLPVPVG